MQFRVFQTSAKLCPFFSSFFFSIKCIPGSGSNLGPENISSRQLKRHYPSGKSALPKWDTPVMWRVWSILVSWHKFAFGHDVDLSRVCFICSISKRKDCLSFRYGWSKIATSFFFMKGETFSSYYLLTRLAEWLCLLWKLQMKTNLFIKKSRLKCFYLQRSYCRVRMRRHFESFREYPSFFCAKLGLGYHISKFSQASCYGD